MEPVIERLDCFHTFVVGEGPHWDAKANALYMVDVGPGNLHCWWPKTNKVISQNVGMHASFIIPVKGTTDEFVVGSGVAILHVKWDTNTNRIISKEVLVKMEENLEEYKVNDAKCDVIGRLWFGTVKKTFDDGSFYSFTKTQGLVKHETPINVSNGLCFSNCNKKMYFIDSLKYRVDEYCVEPRLGTRKFVRTAFDLKEHDIPGLPDGMTMDVDGNLWVACIFGSLVIHVDPRTGKLLRKIQFPKCIQITSLVFGGPDLDELYVTSANLPDMFIFKNTSGAPEAGSVYKITNLGTKGTLHHDFDLNL